MENVCETDQKVMDALVSGQSTAAFLGAACPVLAPGYLASLHVCALFSADAERQPAK